MLMLALACVYLLLILTKAPNITELLYTESVVMCNNYTVPRADPPATSSYTGLAFDATGTLVLSYDRLSNGWSGANDHGAWGRFDSMWTVRVTFQVEEL